MHIEEFSRLLGLIAIFVVGAIICIGVAMVAPSIKDASVAIMNIKAAPQLAQATVDAAQYALQAKKSQDALDILEKQKNIENASLLAKAEADRKVQDGVNQRDDTLAKNTLYFQIALGAAVILFTGLSIFGLYLFSGQQASHKQLALTAGRQAEELRLAQDLQTKAWEIKKAEVEIIGKMVDAAIEKGFAITMPNGHIFTPPPKQLEAHVILDTSLAHQQPVSVGDSYSHEEEKING